MSTIRFFYGGASEYPQDPPRIDEDLWACDQLP